MRASSFALALLAILALAVGHLVPSVGAQNRIGVERPTFQPSSRPHIAKTADEITVSARYNDEKRPTVVVDGGALAASADCPLPASRAIILRKLERFGGSGPHHPAAYDACGPPRNGRIAV